MLCNTDNIAWLFTLKLSELFFSYKMIFSVKRMALCQFQGTKETFLLAKICPSLSPGNFHWLLFKDWFHV